MTTTVYAVFPEAGFARTALGALLDHGARLHDISIVVHEPYADHFTGDVPDADEMRESASKGITTTTPDDAGSGAAKGAAIGLGVGAIAAIASMTVPGVGLVVGGGALATALAAAAGTGVAGAIAGGVTGYLKDQGLPPEVVSKVGETFSQGAAVLSIAVPSGNVDVFTAETLLAKYQGTKIVATEGDGAVRI